MAQELNDATLENLKCCRCSLYLSLGPITLGPNGNICGRCTNPTEKHLHNKIVETLLTGYTFPCQNATYGCTAKPPFGREMFEHEETCEFRPIACPVKSTCNWEGQPLSVFQHCCEQHRTNVLDTIFNLYLVQSEDEHLMTKTARGNLYLLHLLYNSESDEGLSITVNKFSCRSGELQWLERFDLTVRSSDNRNVSHFKAVDNEICIAKSLLSSVDKTSVSLELIFPYSETEASQTLINTGKICDFCGANLSSLYVLTCGNQHYFCTGCNKPNDNCTACSDNPNSLLTLKSNYYVLKQLKTNDVFGCSNVKHGCTFFGSADEINTHEQTCNAYPCLINNCTWAEDIITHIERVHGITVNNEIAIVDAAIEDSPDQTVTHFLAISTRCTANRYRYCMKISPKMFAVVRVSYLDQHLVQITVNGINTLNGFTFRQFKVILGENLATYANKINSLLTPAMSINLENSVYVAREFLKKFQCLKICVSDTIFVCEPCREMNSNSN